MLSQMIKSAGVQGVAAKAWARLGMMAVQMMFSVWRGEAYEALRALSLILRLPVIRLSWCFQLRSMASSTPRKKNVRQRLLIEHFVAVLFC